MIRILKYFIQAILVYCFFLISKLIGLTLSRKFSSFIFKTIGPFVKSKKIVNKNLQNLPIKISDLRKKEIIKNMWSNYGMTFVEYVFLNKFKKGNLHISIKGEEILEKILKNNKPVIFVSGHFANFELMSMEITKRNIKLATIYRPLNNFFLDSFMLFLRKKYICKNQIKKGRSGLKDAINFIQKNHSIALMIDQRLSEGESINFFNKKALTTTLPAQLALKYNLEIIPIFIERNSKDLFEIEIMHPINVMKINSKFEITKKLNQILEDMITKKPDQWIWTHNRWK
tara:strand:- start:4815 stop:5672 length:858 start_codon:yes stop_codon:yes gene_type:complete